jgi:hypothetical protein
MSIKRPKRAIPKPKAKSRSGPSIPNEQRGRPLITMTMSREGRKELVARARRAKVSRGAYVEELLRGSR